ncbi:ABC transporter permease [Pseudobdellovibrio sp. HCB154]|uniref:ABC transporter permease n=1 Tax=Pseudobdellovibrio sp. HCB154 TaxID=3386277 RepID=UPI003916F148
MNLVNLAFKSIRHRSFATTATVFSVVLSLLLLFSVERVRRSVEDSFTQTVSGVDLLVGARTGSLQLVLFSVFNIGQVTNNVSYDSYDKIHHHPDVEWTIPISLGDGHKGYRVVGTTTEFFEHYQVRSNEHLKIINGSLFTEPNEVVLGAEVAETLKYKLGDKIIVAHGSTSGESFEEHADQPLTVVGILDTTGTAVDRSLYVTLAAMDHMHEDSHEGESPEEHAKHADDDHKGHDREKHHDDEHEGKEHDHEAHDHEHHPEAITSFFVKLKSKTKILSMQREITENKDEALLAVIPGSVLSDLWKSLSSIELVLKVISALVMVVGLVGMIIALMTSLNERRREMAILRSLGAGFSHLAKLVFLEVFLILGLSVITSAVLKVLLEIALAQFIAKKFGLYFTGPWFSATDITMMVATVVVGLVFALFPILVFKNKSLKDGLAVK